MGSGSKFDSTLSTRGGRANMVTEADIKNGDAMAKNIIQEMKKRELNSQKKRLFLLLN